LGEDGREQIRRRLRLEKISAARIGIELGRRQRRVFQLSLFLPEKVTAPKAPMSAGPVTVDLNGGALAPGAVDLHEGILAVAGNPICFAAAAIDLNQGVLAIANDFNPDGLALPGLGLNLGVVTIASVNFNARAVDAGRAIVTGKLRCPACYDQSSECDKHSPASRARRWARRGHKGVQRMGKAFPLGKPKGNAGKVAFSPSCS
jgi:hypothetical protein